MRKHFQPALIVGVALGFAGATAFLSSPAGAVAEQATPSAYATDIIARFIPMSERFNVANGEEKIAGSGGGSIWKSNVRPCDLDAMRSAIAEMEALGRETRAVAKAARAAGEFATVNAQEAANVDEFIQGTLRNARFYLDQCVKRTQASTGGGAEPAPPATTPQAGGTPAPAGGVPVVPAPAPARPASLRDQALTANLRHAQASDRCDEAAMAPHLRELDRLVEAAEVEMHSWDGPMYRTIWLEKLRDYEEIQKIREAARKRQAECPKDRRVGLNPQEQQFLAAHNRERASVGAAPLQWDPALAAGAKSYAMQLTSAGQLVHSSREGRKDIRENLLQSLPGRSPDQMIGVWLAEKRLFRPGVFPDVSSTGNWSDIGHYTQMIWATTTHVGCATNGDARFTWLVCRYSPPGNRDGVSIGTPPPPP